MALLTPPTFYLRRTAGVSDKSPRLWPLLLLSAVLAALVAACSGPPYDLGQFHPGRTLVVNVSELDLVPELRYRTIDPQQVIRTWRMVPSQDDLELVLVRMSVQNHTAVSAIVNVDQTSAELRDFTSRSFFPIRIQDNIFRDQRDDENPTVRMDLGQCFDSPRIVVNQGTEVTWSNEGSAEHVLTFTDTSVNFGGQRTATVPPGESASFKFEIVGAFDYTCSADSPEDQDSSSQSATQRVPQKAQVLVEERNSRPSVNDRSILFLDGTFELPRGSGVDGWLVFEAPVGAQFRDLRWRAGDSITVRF